MASVSPDVLIIIGLTLAGLGYLLYHSRVLRRPGYAVPMLLGVGLALLGLLFTIEHWPHSHTLLTVGGLLIGGPYALWFARQRPRSPLAVLKLVWLLSIGACLIWFAYRLPAWRQVAASSPLLFWAILLLSIYQRHIRKTRKEK